MSCSENVTDKMNGKKEGKTTLNMTKNCTTNVHLGQRRRNSFVLAHSSNAIVTSYTRFSQKNWEVITGEEVHKDFQYVRLLKFKDIFWE